MRNKINHLINWLLPTRCIVCGLASKKLCDGCLNDLPLLRTYCYNCGAKLNSQVKLYYCGECLIHPPPFELTIALCQYQFPIPSLITKLKFNRQIDIGSSLGILLADRIKEVYQALDRNLPSIIMPVPLSKQRIRHRGYNQAMEIARPISKYLKVPIDYKSLSRSRHTSPQTLISIEQRQTNVKQAFYFNNKHHYDHVAIIDDVVTTYSTLKEIARTLKRAGVKTIDNWCLAKA